MFLGSALAELSLRGWGVSYPLIYVPDPCCGSRLRPEMRGLWMKEGQAEFSINRVGFRDRDHEMRKPPGTIRIAVLGDSFVEALQVPASDRLTEVLERNLQEAAAATRRRIEVLNFGVSGHGTAQQLQVLRHYVWDYQPDIVLLAFFAGNDLRNNSRELEACPLRPFFVIDRERLTFDDSFRQHPEYQRAGCAWVKWKIAAINQSRVLQMLNEAKDRLRRSWQRNYEHDEYPGIDEEALVEPRTDDWRKAWDLTERLLVEMHHDVRQHKARFFVATISAGPQVDPDPKVQESICRRLQATDLLYPSRRIESLGRRDGFMVVELVQPMQEHAQRHNVYLHGFANTLPGQGHWNSEGHRLAGILISQAIANVVFRP
jgi:hypothetical protein